MKKQTELIRPYLGPHKIQLSKNALASEKEENNIFVFDFNVLTKHVKNALSDYTCDLCSYNPASLDIVWVDRQDEFLDDELLSFWFWRKNGLIPFAFVGDGSENGPFNKHEGVLFFNKTNVDTIEEMPILLLRIEKDNVGLTQIAENFNELKITKTAGNRDLSNELKNEGNSLIGAGDFDGAAEKYFASFQADPTNPTPYNNIGMITQMSRQHADRGELHFQLAYLIDNSDANALRGYGSLLASRTKMKKAIKVMKACVKIEPSAQNYAILSRFLMDYGDYEKSEKALKKAQDIDPDNPEVKSLMLNA